ncbi:MAG: hypothetical protein IPK33_06010 [Gemmatimonadetes bacterium]|nr:hypothetical protein [Gemmatimonadota bacterium]
MRLRLSAEERQELGSGAAPRTRSRISAYLRGRYQWNKRTHDGFLKAIGHFQGSDRSRPPATRWPTPALAFTTSSATTTSLPPRDAYPKAKAAAMRALAIDESLAQAHASLGYTRLFFDWDWAGAGIGVPARHRGWIRRP